MFLLQLLESGYRMECPPGCPNKVYRYVNNIYHYVNSNYVNNLRPRGSVAYSGMGNGGLADTIIFETFQWHRYHIYIYLGFKGSVQRKLRPRLLYIIQKLFSWRCSAKNKMLTFLKGQFTIYIKPLQRSCPSPVTFACKCYSPSANCVCGK